MNNAHKESLELLGIVHNKCIGAGIKYSISADTLISLEGGLGFDDYIPEIYLSLVYCDYIRLREILINFCQENPGFSYHDYRNTDQFETFEAWFVKESQIHFSDSRKKDAFYYGTRLIITPLFYAGDTVEEWEAAYGLFKDTLCTVNARAVLEGKPLKSYIKLSPKRKVSEYYIKKRGQFTIEKCIETYGGKNAAKYVVYPHLVTRNNKDPNSLPWIVTELSREITKAVWEDVEIISFYGQDCYCVKDRQTVIGCFPEFAVRQIRSKHKSHLALNGNTYLWRVQQIQIDLLKEFDRICRKHGLRYNLSFGTLLGAVRHGGFIPWDDDIDVTLPAEDFNKLDELMKRELDPEKYYFRCPANEEHNHLIFKHLERKGTVYTKPGRDKLEKQIGVFIDIFPMYPSAHWKVADLIHAKICRYWRTALWATVGADTEPDPKKREYYKRISKPGNRICYERFVRAASFFKNKKYLKFWIAMDRNPYKVPLVRMSNYTDCMEIEFEGGKFLAPRDYESVLDYCFGHDWSMYPSTRGRIPAHNAIMEIGDLYLKESEGER